MIHAWNKPIQLFGILALFCAACSLPPTSRPDVAVSPTDTALPPPTATATEASESAAMPPPFTDSTSAIVIESQDDLATPTSLPQGVGMPLEQIAIYSPGPGSQVTNPFRVSGWGGPSFDDRVLLQLIGEDGTVLSKNWGYLLVLPGNAGRFYCTMYFSISHVAEEARLEISMQSRRHRQTTHITTVDLTLLSTGNALVHPTIRGTEKLTIFRPRKEAIVRGGSVLVQGAGWVESDTPLDVNIQDNRGNILGSAQVDLDAPALGQLGTFSIEVSYETPYSQWALITVSEPSTGTIPGTIHLTSVEVWLTR